MSIPINVSFIEQPHGVVDIWGNLKVSPIPTGTQLREQMMSHLNATTQNVPSQDNPLPEPPKQSEAPQQERDEVAKVTICSKFVPAGGIIARITMPTQA